MSDINPFRIVKSTGEVEINRSSKYWIDAYVDVVLIREAGVTYTLEQAIDGYWVELGHV